MEGVFEGFSHLVTHGTDEGQGWACAALAQIAFDNAENCIAMVRTPGILRGLCNVMEHSSRDSKAAAALAVNNISAFSEQASAIIVHADVLNINSARLDELIAIPCLKERQARDLFEYVSSYGPVNFWDDLKRVPGFSQYIISQMQKCRWPNLMFSEEPGLLGALKDLCKAEDTNARTDAVGAFNHISRSDQARCVLIKHNIINDALSAALMANYETPDEMDAIVARATMAIANIMAHGPRSPHTSSMEDSTCLSPTSRALQDESEICKNLHGEMKISRGVYKRPIQDYVEICRSGVCGNVSLRREAMEILVRCLHYALKGEKWVGITWGIFSVVHALKNLSQIEENKHVLFRFDLIVWLLELLKMWIGRTPSFANSVTSTKSISIQPRELHLTLHIIANMATLDSVRLELKRAKAEHTLLEITQKEVEADSGGVDSSLWLLRDRHLALCMGQHSRLGAESKFGLLDPAVMRLIVEYTCSAGCTKILAHSLLLLLAEYPRECEQMVSG
mmetsp:Transcript_13935/g.48131  ORF Transcript_13935/g.48131 Transcript_13935/m.48131 type:complete len:508 (-) Transcript_13935:97-1620(-)